MSDATTHRTRREIADAVPRSAAALLLTQAGALSFEVARILGMASDRLDARAVSVDQADEAEALSSLRDDVNALAQAIDDLVARLVGNEDARTFYSIAAPSGRVSGSAGP